MSLVLIAPLPTNAPLEQLGPDGKTTGYLSSDWYLSLFAMIQRLQFSPQVITQPILTLTSQGGSIAPTALSIGSAPTGKYRLTWYTRISQAATTSSTLTIGFSWTDPDGSALSGAGAALTTNTTASVQSGTTTVWAKGDVPLSYFTTYGSVGGTPMLYSLVILAEFLGG